MYDLCPHIPYSGCKQGIMEEIWGTIRCLDVPKPYVIKSCFCGGGSFEYFLARKGFKVIASDIDSSLIDLHNVCRTNPELIEEWGKLFFTKQEFDKIKKERNDAFGAYVRCIWSFGNNGMHYFTALDKEDNKREEFLRGDAEPNSRHRHVEDICLLWKQRPNLDITFSHKSYEDVVVKENEIAYCDIPYRASRGYRSGVFNHDRFYDWFRSQSGLVLLSEYSAPEDFTLLDEYSKWSEANRGARNKKVIEKLYANKPVKKISLF